jgi:hypothetical protein
MLRLSDGMNLSRQLCHYPKSTIYTSNRPGMTNIKPITLEQLFRYYKALPHQAAAIQELEADLSKNGYDIAMRRDRGWFAVWSQSGKQPDPPQAFDNTWDGVLAAARHAGAKFPDVAAAQWALESGWGEHTSGKHNYFGLKGSGTAATTREFLGGQWVTITDKFIDFPSLAACVEYLVSRWYKDYRQHHGVNRAMTRDECAQLLVSEGYATDPEYASKLVSIMDRAAVKNKPAEEKPREIAKIRPGSPFSTRLTPHITLGEFALGQEARRFEHQYQVDMAAELAAFLERVRVNFGGRPVIITSGYRPPAINRSVGGAFRSEHLYDQKGVGAVDFYLQDSDIWAVQAYCEEHWPHSVGRAASRGFVHLGRREGGLWVRWDY